MPIEEEKKVNTGSPIKLGMTVGVVFVYDSRVVFVYDSGGAFEDDKKRGTR